MKEQVFQKAWSGNQICLSRMPASIVHPEANQMGNQLNGRSNMDNIVPHKKFELNLQNKTILAKFVGSGLFSFSCGGAKMKWVYSGGARPISLPKAFSLFLRSFLKTNLTGRIFGWTFLSKNAKVKCVKKWRSVWRVHASGNSSLEFSPIMGDGNAIFFHLEASMK